MMTILRIKPGILTAALLSFVSLQSVAQIYGAGMLGGMQACPYQQEIGDAAEDRMDDIREANEDLKDLRAKISEEKRNKREIESKMKRSRDNLERRSFKGEYLARILDHIESQRECDKYEKHEARKSQSDEKGKTTVSGDGRSIRPYQDSEWFGTTCDTATGGRIMSTACDVEAARIEKEFDANTCVTNLKAYQDANQKLKESEKKLADLDNQEALLKDKIAGLKSDMKAATREYQKEKRREMTEGGCVDCLLQGSGYYYSSGKPNWGGVITNTALGLGSIMLGNNLQKYVANQNARLGYPSQSYPSFGYGFPFIMGAMGAAMGGGGGGFYGAVGGGMGGGAFGCGSGFGGNGNGNMVGGAFGYPAGFFPTPLGGGLYAGYPMGFGAGGSAGLGLGFGLGNPFNPYGGFGNGMYPNMMGLGAGAGLGFGLGNPFNPYGGFGNGMYPNVMGISAGGGAGFGMDFPGSAQMQMQMQQQAMQMQMQQQQMYMQQQQRAQENYMNGSRVVSALYMQLQQAILSLQTGGYFNFGSASGSFGVGGSLFSNQPGTLTPPLQGQPSGTGPSTSR